MAAEVQAIVQSLLTPNSEQFENFLAELMSPDNARRQFAEQVLREMKNHGNLFVRYLVSTMRHSTVPAFRTFSAVLLRKCLTVETPILWPSLSPPVQHEVKSELLKILQSEQVKDVLMKIANAIAELGQYLMLEQGWPELSSVLFSMLDSGSPDALVAAYRIMGEMAGSSSGDISKAQLGPVMERGVTHSLPSVRSEAIQVVCSLAAEKNSLSDSLKPLIPQIMSVVTGFIQAGDIQSTEAVLESLIQVAEDSPKWFKRNLRDIFDPMLKAACSEVVDKSIRILSVELLLSIAEQKDFGLGNIFKTMPNFAECLFEVLMTFLLDIEDVPKWHTAEDGDEDIGNGVLYDFGMESLDRLALAFGGKVLVPITGAMLNGFVHGLTWQKRHAVFICLSQIAEGCDKVMLQEIDVLTDLCMTGLSDRHPKVRWSACQAIGQMCTDLAYDIQASQHHKIVPKLIATMEDNQSKRVQAHAAAAIVNFCDECEEEDVLPYLDSLVPTLIRLLHSQSTLVGESAVTALATVAECVGDQFAVYYDTVMPLLRQMFAQAVDPKLQNLRAKVLECISLVGMAVGADRFRQDASEVMHIIHQLHQSTFSSSDPLPTYMIQAGGRMCRSLGSEFLPYLEIVMPHVMRHLMVDPKIETGDVTDSDDDDDIDTYRVGGKLVKLRTTAMEEKATALEMAACYASVLKEGFLPYVKEITGIAVPLLKFVFNDEIRSAAFKCLPELLGSALSAMTTSQGLSIEFVEQMVEFIWPNAIEALTEEDELEVQQAALHSIAGIIDVLTPQLLSEQMVNSCFKAVSEIFKESEVRRHARINGYGEIEDEEEGDDISAADLDELEEMEIEVLDEISTLMSSFMKKYRDRVISYVVQSLPMVHKLLEKGRSDSERRIAICIIDDILEYCPQAGNNYLHEFLPFLIEGSTNEDPGLRQCSVYGLGVVASKYPEAFQPHIPQLLPSFIRAIQHPSAKSRENELATENIVSAIGKIIHQFPDKVDPEIVDQVWLKNLPLLHDDFEAKTMHELLVHMVEQRDSRIFRGTDQSLFHVVEILVQILAAGESMTTRETGIRILNILHSFSSSMGSHIVNSAVSKMTPKQQKTFHDFSSSLNAPTNV